MHVPNSNWTAALAVSAHCYRIIHAVNVRLIMSNESVETVEIKSRIEHVKHK